jgi:hypothetical protein
MNNGGGAIDSSVTLDEVFAVLGAKRVPLAPELAGYLVLEVAEHADPSGGDVDPKSVFVGEEGTVALVKPKRSATTGDAEASVRAMLARLLDVSGSQTPALAAASKRKSGVGLPALAEELETALVPVNRAAGRRALARLAREVRRVTLGVGRNALPSSSDAAASSRRPVASSAATAEGTPLPPRATPANLLPEEEATTTRRPMPGELLNRTIPAEGADRQTQRAESSSPSDRSPDNEVDLLIEQFGGSSDGVQAHAPALKAMAGLEPTPPPPVVPISAPANGQHAMGEIDSLLAAGAAGAEPRPSPANDRHLSTQPSQLRRQRPSSPTVARLERKPASAWIPVVAIVALGAGSFAAYKIRPSLSAKAPSEHAPPSTAALAVQSPPACRGTLILSNVPPRAEVLLREGQAPVDVDKMPVGARLEFVATAEGYAPKRVVVPSGAIWDTGADGKPRFESAVQLDKASKTGADPWPAGEPGSEVGGQGPPGTVHVVATPRGAEIWMLAGLGPEARIEQLRCDRDLDVLVAGPTTLRKRMHVPARDFRRETPSGPMVLRVNVP